MEMVEAGDIPVSVVVRLVAKLTTEEQQDLHCLLPGGAQTKPAEVEECIAKIKALTDENEWLAIGEAEESKRYDDLTLRLHREEERNLCLSEHGVTVETSEVEASFSAYHYMAEKKTNDKHTLIDNLQNKVQRDDAVDVSIVALFSKLFLYFDGTLRTPTSARKSLNGTMPKSVVRYISKTIDGLQGLFDISDAREEKKCHRPKRVSVRFLKLRGRQAVLQQSVP